MTGLESLSAEMFRVDVQTSKEDLEEFNALPFSRVVGVERGALHPCAVTRWRPGVSIWSGLRESLNARGITPSTGGRCNIGGGVGIARTGFCGPIGALNSCAEALLTSAAAIAIRNIFIFFLSFEARHRLT